MDRGDMHERKPPSLSICKVNMDFAIDEGCGVVIRGDQEIMLLENLYQAMDL